LYAKGTYPRTCFAGELEGVIKGMDPESNTLPKQQLQEPAHWFAGELQCGVVDYFIPVKLFVSQQVINRCGL
jgi:hypothetical protein